MKVLHYISLFGLVGLLTGCLTPEEMGYLVPSEPVYATPGAVPVATPVVAPVSAPVAAPAYVPQPPVAAPVAATVAAPVAAPVAQPAPPNPILPRRSRCPERICPGRAPNGKAARPEMLPLRVGSNRLVSPSPILPRRNRCPGRICRGRVPNGRVVQSEKAALQERAAPAGRAQYTKGSCRASRLRDC